MRRWPHPGGRAAGCLARPGEGNIVSLLPAMDRNQLQSCRAQKSRFSDFPQGMTVMEAYRTPGFLAHVDKPLRALALQ